jgi:VanZ family protein
MPGPVPTGRGPFLFALAASVVVLFWPTAGPPSGPPGGDKLVHAVLFALLAVTGRRAGLPPGGLAAALVGYAVGSELAQHLLLPDRAGSAADVLADLVGLVLGLAVVRAVGRRRVGRRR